ncbi:MAG: hypothetical protein ACM3QS_10985 [Bacteroidota bacterium]
MRRIAEVSTRRLVLLVFRTSAASVHQTHDKPSEPCTGVTAHGKLPEETGGGTHITLQIENERFRKIAPARTPMRCAEGARQEFILFRSIHG